MSLCVGMQKAAVAIVRISGSEALTIAEHIFQSKSRNGNARTWIPETHRIYFGDPVDHNGTVLDEARSEF